MVRFKFIWVLITTVSMICSCTSHKKTGTQEKPRKIALNDNVMTLDGHVGIFNTKLEGDILMLDLGLKNICAQQIKCANIGLETDLSVNKSNPVQLRMWVVPDDLIGAPCSDVIKCTRYFDLSPLKKQYKSGKFTYDKVILNINGRNYGEYSLQ